ncbi:MAG TPA: hypothetical protein VGB42_02185 [Candidatus Thermoplasmatota archaeon]
MGRHPRGPREGGRRLKRPTLWQVVFAIAMGAGATYGGYSAARWLLSVPMPDDFMLLLWVAGILFAVAMALAGAAAATDAAAGLEPRSLKGLYAVAFLLASVAWVVGALLLLVVVVAAIFIPEVLQVMPEGWREYLKRRPKMRG